MRVICVISHALLIWERYLCVGKTYYYLDPITVVIFASQVGWIVNKEA